MALALSLARQGLGRTWPNPSVGCVLVRDGRILARARTADGGRPHAEVGALAGADASGATAYVTLEPCAHVGETPACADELAKAGVARVVIGCGDPDPRTAGAGIAKLMAAGIEVETGVMEAEARDVTAGFLTRVTEGRPFVTLKLASSVDGRIATATGESQWITGPAARRMVHLMRASHDAVMVGAGTARADDPSLTVRGLGIDRQPVRVVLSRRLDVPRDGTLARTAREVPVWILVGPEADKAARAHWTDAGATLIDCEIDHGQISPESALAALGAQGLTRVFCEGGGALAATLLAAGLVDQLVTFTAGLALGAEGLPMIGAMGVDRLAEAPRYALTETRAIGPDAMQIWRRT
ncbi:bifunctional diaminohydroxyphosphoribosylaminopyrimidine deaminase/5-amino-6-(5-phosphoribosylamino)uracil reductase RibD [Pelagovum pacificum]|uniref:Riboflavin biosynthesis protein RibD n=2 Tax=Pelagovum pacificum TaxID=2588711 RepID=A0A5C5GAS3_9RHOB|nr:bifunctional diaminohydroxyphosphoribosylaminopyrimidine deaminase/5-amino-6-(5-phosphoribosylamino)uracil reductase RibD [Pelagovum pacificum]TNY31060.1 bifunctional diaminohydroxyphosphoribosylaminopyrimidine deaminase/5-amino-6-(5-phosphoribosylamino)uracil reductase RibD [Pelagovum pacificum]